jgi:hypothetical protein
VNLIATPLGKGESRDWRGAKQLGEIDQNRGFHVAILFSDLVKVLGELLDKWTNPSLLILATVHRTDFLVMKAP